MVVIKEITFNDGTVKYQLVSKPAPLHPGFVLEDCRTLDQAKRAAEQLWGSQIKSTREIKYP